MRLLIKICKPWQWAMIVTISATVVLHGYQLNFQPIYFPRVPYNPISLISSSQIVWACQSFQGVSVFDPDAETWTEIQTFRTGDYLEASCPFVGGKLAGLRSSGAVEVYSQSGVELLNTISNIYDSYVITALPDSSILVAGINSINNDIQSSIVSNSGVIELEPFNVGVVSFMWFLPAANCSTAVLTLTVKQPGGMVDTVSYRLDREMKTWEKLSQSFKSLELININNTMVGLNGETGEILQRKMCEGKDTLLSRVPGINRLKKLASGQVLGWIQSEADTVPLVYVSNDSGRTFLVDSRFEHLRGYINGIAETNEGALLISIDSDIFQFKSGNQKAMPIPTGIVSDTRTSLSRYPGGRIVLNNPGCCSKSFSIMDEKTLLWSNITLEGGQELEIRNHRIAGSYVVAGDGWNNCIVSNESDTGRLIRNKEGVPVYDMLFDAIPLSEDSVLAFIGRKWLTVELTSGVAELFTTNWPRNQRGYFAEPFASCTFDGTPRRILTATKILWSIEDNDTLATFFDRYGFLASTDGGVTWEMSNTGLGKDIYCWDMKQKGDTVYALTSTGYAALPVAKFLRPTVYKSFDQGRTWTQCWVLPNEVEYPRSLEIGRYGRVLVAGGALAESTDRGETWVLIDGPWTEPPFSCLVTDDGNFYVTTGYHLFRARMPTTVDESKRRIPIDELTWDGHSIRLNSDIDCTEASLFDLYGRSAKMVKVGANTFTLGNAVHSGLYFVRVCNNIYYVRIH